MQAAEALAECTLLAVTEKLLRERGVRLGQSAI
jgi:hypothetical protein